MKAKTITLSGTTVEDLIDYLELLTDEENYDIEERDIRTCGGVDYYYTYNLDTEEENPQNILETLSHLLSILKDDKSNIRDEQIEIVKEN